MARASEREPFPTDIDEFSTDHRIAFDRNTESYKLEDEQGEEWEWLAKHEKWVPVVRTLQPPVLWSRQALWPAHHDLHV